MRAPAPLLDELVAAAQAEQAAARAVMEARQVLTYAGRRLTAAVAHLQGAGIPTTVVAFHVAQAMGLPATVEDRLRLAARLRKRASRARDPGSRTSCEATGGATGTTAAAAEHSNGKEATMAKVVRRKITEEWEEQAEPGEDLADEVDEEVEEDGDEDEEEKPTRRKRR